MPLPLPKLDDRTFDDMVRDAQALIRRRSPGWTDFSAGDPGVTLLEAFAYITDVLLYRVNRIPEKVHVALLNLLGVAPMTPAGAIVRLVFKRDFGLDQPLRLPAGLRVSDPTGAVEFATIDDVLLQPQQEQAEAIAIHAEYIAGELLGLGTGEAGQSLKLRRPPLLRAIGGAGAGVTGAIETMALGVEASGADASDRTADRAYGGKSFILWQEVDSFVGLDPNARAYVLDRTTGVVTFAPPRRTGPGETTALVPGAGQEVRAWSRRGGGRAGNVAPGVLTVLKTPMPGVTVTNPERGSGGEDGETLAEAINRGRDAVGASRTAVTARDFERAAQSAGGVARARAYARRDRWVFADPGVVEVQLVPAIDAAALPDRAIDLAALDAHATPELKARVEAELVARRPLGVRTLVSWTRCRPVSVAARVVVGETEALEEVKSRLLARINTLLAPTGDWPFGRTLRASDVFEAMLREAGIRYVEQLRLSIDVGPEQDVNEVRSDPNLARTFFAATGHGLFRTLDLGASWTLQQGGRVLLVRCDPATPGLLAIVVENDDATAWTVAISRDGGETWTERDRIQNERVYDAAWITRDGRPVLLLATRQALRRLAADGEGGSINIDPLLRPGGPAASFSGFYAIASIRHPSGVTFVAIAAREKGGVLTSVEGSEAASFQAVPGVVGKDVRVLAFQRDGDRVYLWAGISAEGGDQGTGMVRIEARADGIDPAGWTEFSTGWKGGSCESVDFINGTVYAATNRAGILALQPRGAAPAWTGPLLDCGLPINTDRNALVPVASVAAAGPDATGEGTLILAGTGKGIHASTDARQYRPVGLSQSSDVAPLPPYWLYCAGVHDLTLVRETVRGG